MDDKDIYKCPICGFRIFNRRYPRCESCKALLPSELVHSAEEVKNLQRSEIASEQKQVKPKKDGRTFDFANYYFPQIGINASLSGDCNSSDSFDSSGGGDCSGSGD